MEHLIDPHILNAILADRPDDSESTITEEVLPPLVVHYEVREVQEPFLNMTRTVSRRFIVSQPIPN